MTQCSRKFALTLERMLQEIRSYFREMNVAESPADAMLRILPEMCITDQIRRAGCMGV